MAAAAALVGGPLPPPLRERACELMPADRGVEELREPGILRGALVHDLVEKILLFGLLMRFQGPTAWIGSIYSKGGRVCLPGFGLLMRFQGGSLMGWLSNQTFVRAILRLKHLTGEDPRQS